jgi:hypothetical protein
MTGAIRLTDPTNLGPALADPRRMHGIGRRDLARRIAATTGLKPLSLDVKLWRWETGDTCPSLPSLPAWPDALAYDLALIPRADDTDRRTTA